MKDYLLAGALTFLFFMALVALGFVLHNTIEGAQIFAIQTLAITFLFHMSMKAVRGEGL